MERIRARDLEPFNFEEADVSGELWLGEGFTSYYDDLIMRRGGSDSADADAGQFRQHHQRGDAQPGTTHSLGGRHEPAGAVRRRRRIDRPHDVGEHFISYYTFGAAIGLASISSLRDRSDGRTTLDNYMQALWARHGRPGQREPGMVATPYTMDDLKEILAEVSGDAAFARTFFAKYIQGHDVVDYLTLLARAGLALRKVSPGAAFFEGSQQLNFEGGAGARVTSPVRVGIVALQSRRRARRSHRLDR